ncbi:aldose 1-epimerase [Piromyces finnis]|uniref:Aldose 1-epimerase n=1 Tax=Piromyces finnis TaxID=1754191 RepID=A0A1Y1VFH5_9FUNG|nr:aldose 1-epimerase [Piromyces finnis]|eukprot:ORX53701.1 aldose 1-epimerase [Piromyces finnis]
MAISKEHFGKTKDGKEVSLYTLKNGKGMEAVITDFGAILVNLLVKNNKGEVKDVVLGFDKFEDYESNPAFFGSTVGPSANRIAKGECVIEGKKYQLIKNNDGNNLHSDYEIGFHKQMWTAEILENINGVKFSYEMPDGLVGLPGNMKVSVTYSLTEDNELKLEYEGVSDKATIFNLTNHSYFDLAGHDAGKKAVLDTKLTLSASKFTEIDSGAIPTGKLIDVKGTAMDFTSPKLIGEGIDSDWEQMTMVKGYDHNYAIDNYDGTLRKFAVASCDGRTMEVYTDLPGFQFYSGNNLSPLVGKNGVNYDVRDAFCLETQYFPNSVNESSFVSPVKKAGEKYHTVTIYKFLC